MLKKYFGKIKYRYLTSHYLTFKNTKINEIKNPFIMHISDIPYGYYNFVFSIINILKPEIVIHTGDIIDNLKLEINKKIKNEYQEKFLNLIKRFHLNKDIIFILLEGNHDNFSEIEKNIDDNIIFLKTKFKKKEFIEKFSISNFKKNDMNNINKNILDEAYKMDQIKIIPELSIINKLKKQNKEISEKDIYDNFGYKIEIGNLKILISHIFHKEYLSTYKLDNKINNNIDNKIITKINNNENIKIKNNDEENNIDYKLNNKININEMNNNINYKKYYNSINIKNFDNYLDFYLYGHDLTVFNLCNKSGIYFKSGCRLLNGLNYINLIYEKDDKVVRIKYPSSINECRKIRTGFRRGM